MDVNETEVKSAARVLEILEFLTRSGAPSTLAEIVAELGLPKSSAHALMRTLMLRGYVERDEAERYALAPAFRAGGRLAILDVDAPTDRHGTPPRLLVCELQAMGYLRVRREEMADGAYLMIFSAPDAVRRTTSAADVRERVAKANCRA